MDYVATDTVKYPEWVADDRCDTNLGTVRNAWRRERRATDALHDVNKSLADSFRDHRAGVAGIVKSRCPRDQQAPLASRRPSSARKFREGLRNLDIRSDLAAIDGRQGRVDAPQFLLRRKILAAEQLTLDFAGNGHQLVLGLFRPSLGTFQKVS